MTERLSNDSFPYSAVGDGETRECLVCGTWVAGDAFAAHWYDVHPDAARQLEAQPDAGDAQLGEWLDQWAAEWQVMGEDERRVQATIGVHVNVDGPHVWVPFSQLADDLNVSWYKDNDDDHEPTEEEREALYGWANSLLPLTDAQRRRVLSLIEASDVPDDPVLESVRELLAESVEPDPELEDYVDAAALLRLVAQVTPLNAEVHQTGGGTATVVVGDTADEEGHYLVAIGPGSFDWTSPGDSRFWWGDLWVGIDDGGDTGSMVTGPETFRVAVYDALINLDGEGRLPTDRPVLTSRWSTGAAREDYEAEVERRNERRP
jgi:hypothetical protein